jgi:poly(hydroxyalkanoate) depolymerase family esterase
MEVSQIMYGKRKLFAAIAAATSLMCFILPRSTFGGSRAYEENFLVGSYENSEGTRPYKLFVPNGYSGEETLPLVVVLHGCTQDPDNIAMGTRFNSLANIHNFLVLYPQQTREFNANKCWNWFEPEHQVRGSGEPAIIAGMVDYVRENYKVDSNRVFITGLSAGGAMSTIMGACYPDYFAAIGVHSGLEYKSGTNLETAFSAMSNGGPDPDRQGQLAYQCSGSSSRVLPVMVFHGSSDEIVNPVNGLQVIQQFAQMNDYADDGVDNDSISSTPTSSGDYQIPDAYSYTVHDYGGDATPLLRYYEISDMGHAWSGGNIEKPSTYTDPQGPDASVRLWMFFMSHPKN